MKQTVVLVGAGATLAEALPSNPPRAKTPPLDATFFQLCKHAGLNGVPRVKRYMHGHFQIDPFDGTWRMEEVFNYIYSDAHSQSPPQGCLEAYWALLKMYAKAIARTTNNLTGCSRKGVGAVLKKLYQQDGNRQITFITFNHDLIIEKAIESVRETRRYESIPWNLRAAYGMPFDKFIGISGGRPTFRRSGPGRPSIQILKLHGSLNWVYRVRSDGDAKNSIRDPSGVFYCVTSQHISLRVRERGPTRSFTLVPLILPPVYEKASKNQALLGPLWKSALDALHSANSVVIFGYSFPDADIAARALMRKAVCNRGSFESVSVIDTDPQVASKIAGLLELTALRYYETAPAFVADN